MTDVRDVPVVILCGGKGTRLREETERLPKPMVAIGGKPILWHIMKIYGHHGFRRFVLCLGYKGWQIKEYFLRYREHVSDLRVELASDTPGTFLNDDANEDWEIVLAETGEHTATAARLHRVARYLDHDRFALTYGDGIGSVDLSAAYRFHRENGRIGTVTGVHPTSRYGEMRVSGGAVTEFNEKPTKPEGFVNAGFFFFESGMLDYVDDDDQMMLEQVPLQRLSRDGQLAVYPHEGFWLGMDTYRDWAELDGHWQSGTPPWKVWDG